MAIDQVSLRVQSADLDASSLQRLVGYAASRAVERWAPVSSRAPDGPVHPVTTVVYVQDRPPELLDDQIRGLSAVLTRLEALAAGNEWADHSLVADLIVGLTADPMGFQVSLESSTALLLARARCGLVIDAYDSDPG